MHTRGLVIVCRASRRAFMYKYKGIRWNTEYVRTDAWLILLNDTKFAEPEALSKSGVLDAASKPGGA